MDGLEASLTALTESYRKLIQDDREFAIQVDDRVTSPYRDALAEVIATLSERAFADLPLQKIRSLVGNAKRDYKASVEKYLAALRRERDESAAALHGVLNTLASGIGDHDLRVRTEIKELRALAVTEDADALRKGIHATAIRLETCIDELKSEHQLQMAELAAEIQVLHQRIERDRAAKDPPKGMQEALKAALAGGAPFSFVVASIRNLNALRVAHGERAVDSAVAASMLRLSNEVLRDGIAGTWLPGVLAAIGDLSPLNTIQLSRLAAHRLSGAYLFTDASQTCEIVLQVGIGVVQRQASEKLEQTEKRIEEVLRLIGAG